MAVIPPIIVEKFTCGGNGLLYEGHARESPAGLRAMITSGIPISDKDQTNTKPKSWWLAQTLLYGLPGNKSSTIGQLRERLQTALEQRNGMAVPEKILNVEVDANKEFNELNARIALKTQPGTLKGKAKATDDPLAPKLSRSRAPAKGKEPKKAEAKPKPAAKAAPAPSKAKTTFDPKLPPNLITRTTATSRTKKSGASVPPATAAAPIPSGPAKVTQGKREREREDETEVDLWLEHRPPRKRAHREQPTDPFAWPTGTASTLSRVRVRYRSRHHEKSRTD